MTGRRRPAAAHDRHGRSRHGRRARVAAGRRRQFDQALELPLDGLGQGEGVEAVQHPDPMADHGGIGFGAGLQALERGARRVVAAAEAGADALLTHELDRGQEEVLKEAQWVPVEVVQRGDGGRRVVAEVADQQKGLRALYVTYALARRSHYAIPAIRYRDWPRDRCCGRRRGIRGILGGHGQAAAGSWTMEMGRLRIT